MARANSADSRAHGVLPVRYLVPTLVSIIFLMASYPLCLRLISQIYYLRATNCLRDGFLDLAVKDLKKALDKQANDPSIWKRLGKAYHNLAGQKPVDESFQFSKKAKDAYLRARNLNPLDAQALYGLASEEARLEQIYPYLYFREKDNPYNALPYFQEAIRLRPNCTLYYYALARYLHRYNKTQELLKVISNLVHIYPSVYSHIKKEAFWSLEVKEAVKRGLKQAIDDEINIQNAHIAMSSLLAGESDWAGAVSHYQKSLDCQSTEIHSGNYLHLGRLYLENGQLGEAEKCFLKGISISETREKDLESLFGIYKRNACLEELCRFYHRVIRRFELSSRTYILLARSLIDLKRYNQARQILRELNQKGPTAEAYYWLSRIAKEEKDWDSMELSIQRATVLDKENSQYHLLFSQVLKRLKKMDRAEKEAGLAIKYSSKPSPWLYNHRAWVRWGKKDYQGSTQDWQRAIELRPDNAYFYAQVAEAYKRLGDISLAIDFYQKALKFEPENMRYKKRYLNLQVLVY